MTQKPPYKTKMNVWRTSSLFYEPTVSRDQATRYEDPPVFTLYEDKPGFINARKTFIELGDPTGYKWAITYLDSWIHWEKLLRAKWFKEAYDSWMVELNAKLQSEAISKIREIAMDPESKSALPAARYLAELEKKRNTKGRPAKATIDAELKRITQIDKDTEDDAQRIGLKVVN